MVVSSNVRTAEQCQQWAIWHCYVPLSKDTKEQGLQPTCDHYECSQVTRGTDLYPIEDVAEKSTFLSIAGFLYQHCGRPYSESGISPIYRATIVSIPVASGKGSAFGRST